jgi:hypoxanthine phosphoribosyltransferase
MEDKYYVTWDEYGKMTKRLGDMILGNKKKYENVYGVPRGGAPIAVALSHRLDIPYITNPNAITDQTLIVDDIVDTGKELYKLINVYSIINTNCDTCSLYKKPDPLVEPTYSVETTTKWIVFPYEQDCDTVSNVIYDESKDK